MNYLEAAVPLGELTDEQKETLLEQAGVSGVDLQAVSLVVAPEDS